MNKPADELVYFGSGFLAFVPPSSLASQLPQIL
jgi:hypothetical protein